LNSWGLLSAVLWVRPQGIRHITRRQHMNVTLYAGSIEH